MLGLFCQNVPRTGVIFVELSNEHGVAASKPDLIDMRVRHFGRRSKARNRVFAGLGGRAQVIFPVKLNSFWHCISLISGSGPQFYHAAHTQSQTGVTD